MKNNNNINFLKYFYDEGMICDKITGNVLFFWWIFIHKIRFVQAHFGQKCSYLLWQ